jgi:hypothetical protein
MLPISTLSFVIHLLGLLETARTVEYEVVFWYSCASFDYRENCGYQWMSFVPSVIS